MSELKCIRCECVMENYIEKGQQPDSGLAFHTHGHYGSAFFDPMDSSYIGISVCDDCVKQADAKGLVYWSAPRRETPVDND